MASVQVNAEPPGRWQRRLLPGSMIDGPEACRSLRDWMVDALVFLCALALGVLGLATGWDEHGSAAKAFDIALGIVSLAALWVRRRHPLGVATLAVAASAVSALAAGAALVAVFNVAIRCDRRALAWVTVAAIATGLFYGLRYPGDDLAFNIAFGLLAVAIAVGWGLFVRARRDLVDSLRERAARLEAEGRLRDEAARAAERERIAREMHDVLAHRLSLLSLHAGALEFRPGAPAAEVAATAAVVREAAAAALEELRDVIGVLREGTEVETERPQPTLADLPTLIEESRAAGMRIEAELDLPAAEGEVGAGAGRTAFRVVQEGLTNARKHAPAALVGVRVRRVDGALAVEVRNRAPLVAVPTLPGAGSGLIGLGERVELAGGELRHEVSVDGDFVLTANLPTERPVR